MLQIISIAYQKIIHRIHKKQLRETYRYEVLYPQYYIGIMKIQSP